MTQSNRAPSGDLDPYAELGVPKHATIAQIRAARRRKAAKLHPDRKGGNADAMARCNLAHDILVSPERRRQWEAGQGTTMPDSEELQARKLVIEGFSNLWKHSMGSSTPVNIPRAVEKAIADGVKQIPGQIAKLEDEIEAMRSYLGEVETDDPADLFNGLIQSHIAAAESKLAKAKSDLTVGNLAIALAKRYRSKVVELPPHTSAWYEEARKGPRVTRYKGKRKR
jgi:curved DNA-binding protein CbpA